MKVLIQLLYSSKSKKVQAQKCTQSIKVKNIPSEGLFYWQFLLKVN